MVMYVALYTKRIDLSEMIFMGVSLSERGALEIAKQKFKKLYKDPDVIQDTDKSKYFISTKHAYEPNTAIICIREEGVR